MRRTRAGVDARVPCAARADDTDTENIEHQHRRGASDSRCFSRWPQAKLSRDTWYTAATRGCSAYERMRQYSRGVVQHGAWWIGAAGAINGIRPIRSLGSCFYQEGHGK